jgi:hypothetical protein
MNNYGLRMRKAEAKSNLLMEGIGIGHYPRNCHFPGVRYSGMGGTRYSLAVSGNVTRILITGTKGVCSRKGS